MFLPTMNLIEVRREFLKDCPIVHRKGEYLLKDLKHSSLPHGDEKIDKFFDYVSKQKNNWIIRCEINRRHSALTFCAYYYSNKGLVAINSLHNDSVLIYHTSHFLQRMNERLNLNLTTPKEILMAFLKEFEAYNGQKLEMISPWIFKLFSATNKGICLGTHDTNLKFTKMNTFITHEMLRGDQISLAQRLSIVLEKYKADASNLA